MVEKDHKASSRRKESHPRGQAEPQSAGVSMDAGGQAGAPPVEPAPVISQAEFAAVQVALEQANQKASEYLEGWQRALAEFSNYKKRIERDQAQTYQSAAGNVIRQFLEVMDDLDRALVNRPKEGDGATWAEGIELIYRKLVAVLDAQGVTLMNLEGQLFDPNLHEAISQEDSPDHESGQIIAAVQPGYLLGDRVLRPARVRVAR